MTYEKEITVEIDCDLKELKHILKSNNFEKKREYDLIDYYLIREDYDTKLDYLDILKQCILLRTVLDENQITNLITYKYKEYNEQGDILKQGKIDCKIESINDVQSLFEAIGYFKIIEIKDHITVYANETSELAVQEVNNKHIYIEIEEKCNCINKVYASVDEMKDEISKYKIPIKGDNYFVKKALIELKEHYK